jgi:alanine dehydrogenase
MSFVWLGNANIEPPVSMAVAPKAVEAAFRAHGNGEAGKSKRSRAIGRHGRVAITVPAVLPYVSRMGFKAFSVGMPPLQSMPPAPPVFAHYDADGGARVALMDANALGFIRTGAAMGVATDLLSRPDSRTVGTVRRRQRGAPATGSGGSSAPAADACDVVSGCDIVVTATTSHAPIFDSAWVEPGTHISAVGSNFADRCAIDAATVAHAALVAVDVLDQVQE